MFEINIGGSLVFHVDYCANLGGLGWNGGKLQRRVGAPGK